MTYRGLHALRHTCGTRLQEQTQDITLVAQQLGHSQLDTARIYAKMSRSRTKKAVGDW